MKLELTVNGKKRSVETDARRSLLEVLREDLELTGTKYGCGEGDCRACTVLLEGKPVTSCRVAISKVDGRSVVTIEGLAAKGKLHPVQQAFLDAGAMQCGYCVPGMILSTAALLEAQAHPTKEQVIQALNGNLCRCCGYVDILDAALRATKAREEVLR